MDEIEEDNEEEEEDEDDDDDDESEENLSPLHSEFELDLFSFLLSPLPQADHLLLPTHAVEVRLSPHSTLRHDHVRHIVETFINENFTKIAVDGVEVEGWREVHILEENCESIRAAECGELGFYVLYLGLELEGGKGPGREG